MHGKAEEQQKTSLFHLRSNRYLKSILLPVFITTNAVLLVLLINVLWAIQEREANENVRTRQILSLQLDNIWQNIDHMLDSCVTKVCPVTNNSQHASFFRADTKSEASLAKSLTLLPKELKRSYLLNKIYEMQHHSGTFFKDNMLWLTAFRQHPTKNEQWIVIHPLARASITKMNNAGIHRHLRIITAKQAKGWERDNRYYLYSLNGKPEAAFIWELSPSMVSAQRNVYILIILLTVSTSLLTYYMFRFVAQVDQEAREYKKRAQHLTVHDPLTNLPNRIMLAGRLTDIITTFEFSDVPTPQNSMALIRIGLDRFRSINDILGNQVGDLLIQAVADRLQATICSECFLARTGGDEFTVLQGNQRQPDGAIELAVDLLKEMEKPFIIEKIEVKVSASIGIAIAPNDGLDANTLLQRSNISLSTAKKEGLGRYCLFDDMLEEKMLLRQELEEDLRTAIINNDLTMAYQPQIDSQTGVINAVEALARWKHPTRGYISPAIFMPIAEETGEILPLTRWILERSCLDALKWDPSVTISVNISPMQFRHHGMMEMVLATLEKTNLPPERLELEITEGVFMDTTTKAKQMISEIRSHGIRIALDDFGTGYSSLSYLNRFPVDKIKIDRSFVMTLGAEQDSAAIVRAIIQLAHTLGMKITAEGVETEEQMNILLEDKCDFFQGYLFSKPLFIDAITPTLQGGKGYSELLTSKPVVNKSNLG